MTETGPLTVATAARRTIDPYARVEASAVRFLYRLNPLAKLAAPLPAMAVLVFVRDAATPAAFLLLAYAVLLVGVRFTRRLAALLFVALPLGVLVIGLGFALWTDVSRVDQSVVVWQIGGWSMYGGALAVGYATAVRLAAILALTLIVGLSTTGPDLVRASVQQLRVPYRIGYTALAAFRFVPRFGYELDVIRQAHRVRGAHGGRGPFAAVARWFGYIVPLLAGAIRHAERVALAMDARAFGAHPDRTERHLVPWRVRDTVFVLAFWAVSAAILWAFFPWGL
ncbi:energy-coupling factor transporter transmembrane component T [Microbacterium atlanticum]|uniref:energy-coupling factor transporter transmembrane component T n=1 Tax=Microbacterium atlanticum TaxID=2782168 RepID=UPI0018876216|nr:energy-coupling factor transporter transmembrane component T [Microbacterium atlanticum]